VGGRRRRVGFGDIDGWDNRMCDGIRPNFLLFRYFVVSRVCMICSIYCKRNMYVYILRQALREGS
jgi:hypothetical protein